MNSVEFASFSQELKFKNAQQTYIKREGYLLRQKGNPDSNYRYGEIAPLPGFSLETLEQITHILSSPSEHQKIYSYLAGEILNFPASLQFALDSLDFNLPTNALVAPLMLNAVFDIDFTRAPLASILELLSQGYRCLKLKISPQNLGKIVGLMLEINHRAPILFRLDANNSLTRNEFLQFCDQLPLELHPQIEYIEDPFPGFWQNPMSIPIPLAIDQDLPTLAKNSFDSLPSDFVYILKPSVQFGLKKTLAEITSPKNVDKKMIISSALDGDIGLMALRNFSFLYANRQFAHGLATAGFLKNGYLKDSPFIRETSVLSQEASKSWLDKLNWQKL